MYHRVLCNNSCNDRNNKNNKNNGSAVLQRFLPLLLAWSYQVRATIQEVYLGSLEAVAALGTLSLDSLVVEGALADLDVLVAEGALVTLLHLVKVAGELDLHELVDTVALMYSGQSLAQVCYAQVAACVGSGVTVDVPGGVVVALDGEFEREFGASLTLDCGASILPLAHSHNVDTNKRKENRMH